jgi:hypothetical protein
VDKPLDKAEVDRVFSYNKTQWTEAASLMAAPGWTHRITEHQTGVQVIAFNPSTGCGISIQPLFNDDRRPPQMVIVGSYVPVGMMPPVTEELKAGIKAQAQEEIGPAYSLEMNHQTFQNMERFEFLITEL